MSTDHPGHRQTYLFTLRLWQEPVDEDHLEWRGILRHTLTDERYSFRELTSLIPILLSMLRQVQNKTASPPALSLDEERG